MFRRILYLLLFILPFAANAEYSVRTIDLLPFADLQYNAAGPMLVLTDTVRNRIIAANTLSSSLTIIDGKEHIVTNIPVGGRCLQHLKSEAMTYSRSTGFVYLIGVNKFFIVDVTKKKCTTVETKKQFESIAVDETTGNVFLAGRESAALGFYNTASQKLEYINWLEHEEKLLNMNQTPPPPIRKVVAAGELNYIIALDGFTPKIYLFDAKTAKLLKSRPIELTEGGRWHLAGYNQENHCLYLVTETATRKVIEAAKIGIRSENDEIIKLPEFTEGVGICYEPKLDMVLIPYDNHPSVHAVDFRNDGKITEIKIPCYGNDASAIDFENDILYIGSWAHGEVEVIDLKTMKLTKVIPDLGIIPHMFTMTFNPKNKMLYFPKGASAVNGCFGAAVTCLDPIKGKIQKILTGWAPISIIDIKDQSQFLIFNNEDQCVRVDEKHSSASQQLPFDYPITAIHGPDEYIYLSYGPHQSYWPTVYIWGAKNGIMRLNPVPNFFNPPEVYDRRIPRQAMQIALGKDGAIYMTQNCWGREPQFVGILRDEVRYHEIGDRIQLNEDTVQRETIQRMMKYDKELDRLYLCRVAEDDKDPGILQIIDAKEKKLIKRLDVGLNPTDLLFDENYIYVANFSANAVSIIDKNDFSIKSIPTGENPLKLCKASGTVYVINHTAKSIQELKENGKTIKIPYDALPDNVFEWQGKLTLTCHSAKEMYILVYRDDEERFDLIYKEDYPFGETSFNTINSAFYLSGQFGDAIYSLTNHAIDQYGNLWLTDFLSGKLYIVGKK